MLVNTAHIREALTPRQSESLFDVPLMYSMLMLIGVGFVMVTSASMPVAERLFDNPYHFTYRHVVFLIGSLILFWFATNVPMTWWKRSNPYLLLFGLVLLVAVLIIGREVNGAKRWIPLGPFGLQVAEASKLFSSATSPVTWCVSAKRCKKTSKALPSPLLCLPRMPF